MSGHVVYSCACLNIKLHLANKYLLNNHDNDRKECFVRLDNPPLEGRQFELGMGGVQAEYNSLMTTRLVGKDRSWMTVTCLNCSTGDVYSVRRPPNERGFAISYPVDVHSLYRTGDRVIIHDNTLFGGQIEAIKQRQNYSHNFGIVLNSDAQTGRTEDGFEDTIPGDLYSQHGQLKQILDRSLKQMQLETEERIEQYRRDQLQELERASTQAKCDRDFLWQRILEASRTVNEERQLRKRVASGPEHQSADIEASHVRFAEEQRSDRSESPIRPQQIHHQSLTSSYSTPSSIRKASFALDERVIEASWRNTSHLPQIKATSSEGLDLEDNGDSDDVALSDQDDSDGLFDLDEEIDDDSSAHEDAESSDKKDISSSYKGSMDWRKKRSNTKYLSTYDEGDEEPERRRQSSSNDLLSTSVSAYATSMPIAISHMSEGMKEMPNENAVNPADQDPTTTGSSIQKNSLRASKEVPLSSSIKDAVDYDKFSYADQELSKMFPQDRRRKSIAVTGATPRPQLDSLVGQSLDTRRRLGKTPTMRGSDYQHRASYHEAGSEDEQEGPMVPPHILAANTFTDETEEMFGAVPRSNTWRKTYD